MGIVGGAAFVIIAKGAQAAQDSVKETDKAFKELKQSIALRPKGGAGADEIKAHIESLLGAMEKIGPRMTKARAEFEAAWQGLKNVSLFQENAPDVTERHAKQIVAQQRGVALLISDLKGQADAESRAAEATRIHSQESEELGDQQKIEADTAAEIAKIQHEATQEKQKVRATKVKGDERDAALEKSGNRDRRIGIAQGKGDDLTQAQRDSSADEGDPVVERMGLVCCQESENSTGAREKQALAMANIKALEAQRVAAEGLAEETRNELDAKIAGAKLDEQQRREQAKLKSVEPLTEKGKLSFEGINRDAIR